MAVFNIRLAADASFPGSPANGQVLQYSAAEGNKWTYATLPASTGFVTTAQSSAYTAVAGNHVLANASSASFTVTLPSAATAGVGATVRVTKTDTSSNVVAVRPPSGNLNGQTVSGSLTNTASQTSNYTAATLQNVLCNAAGGGFTVTLPAPTNGNWLRVVKTDSSVNGVLIVPPSGTIDGQASLVVNSQSQPIFLRGNGTAWSAIPETYATVKNALDTISFVSDGSGWWSVY